VVPLFEVLLNIEIGNLFQNRMGRAT
jgi:hypothetical protein